MDAMLLAAGLGTRLRPLTDHKPKALVEVAGVPMLERVARRVIQAGADRLIINTHHFAEEVERFVASRDGFGVEVAFSVEADQPLETGGAVKHAAPLFRTGAPFFLHNTDIITDVSLRALYRAHQQSGALATVLVGERETTRYLLFDDAGLLGRTDLRSDLIVQVRAAAGEPRRYSFQGVHVLSPALLGLITERGVFSILDLYIRLAAEGHRIEPYRIGDALWLDIGSPDKLAAAERVLAEQGTL